MPLPESYQLNGPELQYDFGSPMLRTFARIIEPDGDKRNRLLKGEVWPTVGIENGIPQYPEKPQPPEATNLPAGQTPPAFVLPPTNVWSEPFVDLNNNKQHDDNEVVYLDQNNDKRFTENALIPPPDDNDLKYFVGLLDRYQKNNWWRWRVNEASWENLYPVQNPEASEENPETTPNSPTE